MVVIDSSVVLPNGINGNQSWDCDYDVDKFFGKPFVLDIVDHKKKEKVKPFVLYGDDALNSILSEKGCNADCRQINQDWPIQIRFNPEQFFVKDKL